MSQPTTAPSGQATFLTASYKVTTAAPPDTTFTLGQVRQCVGDVFADNAVQAMQQSPPVAQAQQPASGAVSVANDAGTSTAAGRMRNNSSNKKARKSMQEDTAAQVGDACSHIGVSLVGGFGDSLMLKLLISILPFVTGGAAIREQPAA